MSTRKETTPEIPLAMLRKGDRAVIKSIGLRHGFGHGGGERCQGFQRRLMEMGLTPGTSITLIKSVFFGGPVELEVRGSRLILGHGIANKISVERIES